MAEATGGFIFTSWNQVRQTDEAGMGGTRTGRLSCPYFMNITKDWNKDGSWPNHPSWMGDFPELPMVRRYILPDEDGLFLHRDYSQQEFRILAHFEDDVLLAAFRSNPRMDFHKFMQAEIERITHHQVDRPAVKILNFGILYGMGNEKLAKATGTWDESRCLPGCTHENQWDGTCHAGDTAKEIKGAQRHALPGLRNLEDSLLRRGRRDESIRTWGGRYYHAEPPVFFGGRKRSFEYKLLNYLIQGSAADCTKEAVIRYDQARVHGRLLVTVHDEINITAPAEHAAAEMKILKDVMESIEFDVPMLSEGKSGKSWGDLSKYEEAA
jgi:DNA polymerase-1